MSAGAGGPVKSISVRRACRWVCWWDGTFQAKIPVHQHLNRPATLCMVIRGRRCPRCRRRGWAALEARRGVGAVEGAILDENM